MLTTSLWMWPLLRHFTIKTTTGTENDTFGEVPTNNYYIMKWMARVA